MDTSPYLHLTQDLFAYEEFRTSLHVFRLVLLGCCLGFVALAVLHTLYYLGQRTPMYRKKPPVDGWNRRFFSAVIPLLAVLLLLSWGIKVLLVKY